MFLPGMSNVLAEDKRQQALALGRLGWSLRQIERTPGVRRETASSDLKAAGVVVRGRVRPSARPAKPAISPEVSTDSSAAPSPCAGMGPAAAASGDHPNRAPRASACEPYRELIVEAVGRGRNAMAIWQYGHLAGPGRCARLSGRVFQCAAIRLQAPAASRRPGPGSDHDGTGAASAGRLRRRADGP